MPVSFFQPKGRNHIRYINRVAHNIWEKYGYDDKLKRKAILEALATHVQYLRDVVNINDAAEKREDASRERSKISTSTGDIYWKENGKWVPLVPNHMKPRPQ